MSRTSMHDEQVLVDTRRKNTLKKVLHRQLPLIIVMALIAILCFWAGTAWGNETKKQVKSLTVKQVNLRVYREDFISSTTTTTTTLPKKRVAVHTRGTTEKSSQAPSVPQGAWADQCKIWMNAAGISQEFFDEALYIIEHESHCSPVARNPSSMAGGIPQGNPYTKMGCALEQSDEAAICQLKWMNIYVGRYGGWVGAAQYKRSHGSY